jgi:hypothetical protein
MLTDRLEPAAPTLSRRPAVPGLLPRATIFDFDGTLADMSPFYALMPGRQVRVARELAPWDPYHQATADAVPIEWVLALARIEHEMGRAVLVVTARDERWREVTETWLQAHPIPHTELLMRPAGDRREDPAVKGDILADLRTRYDVQMAVDDRPSVVKFWKTNAIPTVHVPSWPSAWGET